MDFTKHKYDLSFDWKEIKIGKKNELVKSCNIEANSPLKTPS